MKMDFCKQKNKMWSISRKAKATASDVEVYVDNILVDDGNVKNIMRNMEYKIRVKSPCSELPHY